MSPRNRKFMPSVDTSEDSFARVTSRPLTNPASAPADRAARTAKTGLVPAWTTNANAQAATPMTAGNARSISPAAMTNTSGTARMMDNGKDVKTAVYSWKLRKTLGLAMVKATSRTIRTPRALMGRRLRLMNELDIRWSSPCRIESGSGQLLWFGLRGVSSGSCNVLQVPDQLISGRDFVFISRQDYLAPVEDHEPIGDVIGVINVVADEDARTAALFYLPDEAEHLL
jgi:hypothetical protein